jgi:integrase
MPKQAKGEMRWGADGGTARITIKGKHRESFGLPTCKTPDEATERTTLLSNMAQRFRRAGVIETREARQLLETAAGCVAALLPGVLQVAGELAGGKLVDTSKPEVPTFEALAKEWTDGKLHHRFPDHVKEKDSDIDEKRLAHLSAIDVGGVALGDLPLDAFTVQHAETAMQSLPESAKRPATRRQYAQLLHRVLALAVYPCRHIAANPLPKGFMPKIGKPPGFTYLRPKEDAALMASAVPLCWRVLFGFLSREGCRKGEALAFQVRDFDLETGNVKLDENKTDDPRSWALDKGVARALKAWVALRGAGPDDPMFVDEGGQLLTEEHRLSEVLREALLAAGVNRHEIHHDSTNRLKLRVHDLRGTFVTLKLANGKTETWVADRTGHTSSQMINRYRRKAREVSELSLGDLLPLDEAIDEFRQRQPTREQWQPLSDIAPRLPQDGTPEGTRTPDRWIRNPLLYPAELRAHGPLST